MARHSSSRGEQNQLDTNGSSMSVLPRLLRTITGQSINMDQQYQINNEPIMLSLNANDMSVKSMTDDSQSSRNDFHEFTNISLSSVSLFSSLPSCISHTSGSPLISFLAPANIGSVCALAAPVSSSSMIASVFSTVTSSNTGTLSVINEVSQPSGLVTLATASSLIERGWQVRTTIANQPEFLNSTYSTSSAHNQSNTSTGSQNYLHELSIPIVGDCSAWNVSHSNGTDLSQTHSPNDQFLRYKDSNDSPPLILKSLNNSIANTLSVNDSFSTTVLTPSTRTVLDVHSMFIDFLVVSICGLLGLILIFF